LSFLGEDSHFLFELLVVLLNKLTSLFKQSLLLAQLVVLVSHLPLSVLNVDLFALDFSDECLANILF
jgi:hypothetical protein